MLDPLTGIPSKFKNWVVEATLIWLVSVLDKLLFKTVGSISDSKLKENIQDFTYSIDTFKQFEPKTFTWKNPEMHKAGTIRGFTGQDIESVDNYFARTQAIDPKKGGAQGEDNPDYGIIPDNVAKLSKLTEKDAMYISVIKQLIARIEALES